MKPRIFTPFRSRISNAATFAVVLTLFTAPCALAATLYWDGGSVDILTNGNGASSGGTGTWDTTILNWDAGASPHVAWTNGTDTAEINGGTQTLTLGADITVGRINQKAGASGATINEGAGPYRITLANATTIFNVAASTTASRTLNVNAEITGNRNLSIQGPTSTPGGAVNLNRINTFTGTLSIDDTNLRIGNGGTPGQLNSGNYSSAISITSTGTFTYASSLDQTLGGVISGAGRVIKNNAGGTLTLTNSNSYSGTTTINDGKFIGVVGGHHQNSDVTLNNLTAATYGVSITDNTKSWTCKSLATTAAGTLEFNFGAVTPSGTTSPLIVTNLADFSATPLVSVVVSAGLSPGIYPLMTWGSTSGTVPTTAELTLSTVAPGTEPTLSVLNNTLTLVISSDVSPVVKADNTDNLSLGSSWVGDSAPTVANVTVWNSIVTSPNTTDLGADLTWAGIIIENPAGPVTINSGNTLTLGDAAIDLDLGTATNDLTLNCDLALANDHVWNVATARTLTLGGQLSGAFPITKLGDGTAILSSAANNYTGITTVNTGTLKLGSSNVIPHGTGGVAGNVVVNGTLDLNGNSDSINGLSGSGIIDNTGAATSTFSVGDNDQTSTFSGVMQNSVGTINLVKTGSGTLVLGGANTMTGSVNVDGGTLAFSNTTPFANASGIALADDTTLRPDVVNATIFAPITLGAAGTTATINAPSIVGGGGTTPVPVTLAAGISGAGNLTFNGTQANNAYGTIILNAASDYTGSTLITCTGSANTEIFVRLGVENALPVTTILTLDGGDGTNSDRYCQVDLQGFNQTLTGLSNIPRNNFRKQQIINSSATAATLTINNSADMEFSGRLGTTGGQAGSVGANLGLTKSGSGIFTLSGNNAYTGSTTITGGTLALGASNVLPSTPVSIGGGSLAVGAGFSDAVGTLALTSAATINLANTSSALAFQDSSGEIWSDTLTLSGTFVSGASLRFGDGTGTGLTPAQLASISATGFTDFGLDVDGYLTATEVGGGGYTAWAADNAGGQTADLDFDNDGVTNGVEFFLNAAPGFTANPQLDGSNTITWTNGGNIPASAYGTEFVVQTSGNLESWTEVPVEALTTNTDGPGGALTYTLAGTSPRFVRLKVMPE